MGGFRVTPGSSIAHPSARACVRYAYGMTREVCIAPAIRGIVMKMDVVRTVGVIG